MAKPAKGDLERISLQVENLSLQMQRQALQDGQKPPAPKTWSEAITQFAALAGVLLALVLTFSQIRSEQVVPSLTAAEEKKAIADAAKANADTAKVYFELSELQRAQDSGRKVDLQEIDRLIPRLRNELQQSMDQQTRYRAGMSLVVKFVVLTIAWMAIGLLFAPLGILWGSLISMGYQMMDRARPKYNLAFKGESESQEAYHQRHDQLVLRWERVERAWRYATLLLAPIPSVLEWSLRILLFAAVAMPLFDQAALFLGMPTHFSAIVGQVLTLDISGAIASLRDLINR